LRFLEIPIPLNARVRTQIDLHVVWLTYGYFLVHDERKELGLNAGLDFVIVDVEVKGHFGAARIRRTVESGLVGENFDIPFPTVGLYFNWASTTGWPYSAASSTSASSSRGFGAPSFARACSCR